ARTFIAMGGPETPVNILHWKADWQTDIDLGHYQDREDAYPNMAYDLYIGKNEEQGEVLNYDPETQDFEEQGTGDPRIPVTELNIDYQPGMKAGAFTGDYWLDKVSPVEELVAEGFGTLTTQRTQNTLGKGVYENEIWSVVILRPMLTKDMTDKQFRPGEKTDIAFAIWDGGNREVNGRKSVALWHDFVVEAGVPSAGIGTEPLTVPAPGGGDSTAVVVAGIIAAGIVAAAVIFYAARRRVAPTAPR
ncbi:MAG: ethylbenzene dehydrogenase-related protein, partial [Nitrososphaerales archaeon]